MTENRDRVMNMAGNKTTFFEVVKLLLHRRKKIKEEEQKSNRKIHCDSTEKYFLQKTNSFPHYVHNVNSDDIKMRTHSVKNESQQYSKRKYQSLKVRPSSSQNIHDQDDAGNQLQRKEKQMVPRKLSIKRVTSLKKYKASKLNQSLPNINEQVFDLPDAGEARTISSSVYTVDSVDVNTKKLFRYNPSASDDNDEVDFSFE